MTNVQKLIKYLALVLAFFLIITIFSAITMAIYGIANEIGLKKDKERHEMVDLKCSYKGITSLDIDINYSNLDIKLGREFLVQTDNKEISCKDDNGKLVIEEKDKWFSWGYSRNLVVYIPDDFSFEKVNIESGAGSVDIESIVAEKLKLDLGAGKTDIDNLIVSKDAFINTGAGKFQVLAGSINNLDFDIGVGEANIKTKLTGVNRFDAGVGALKLNLLGNLDDYRIKVSKGIGNISIDSKNVSEGEIGNGDVIVDIDGGIGEIKVDFNE